jgi:hypothetical protein
MMMDKLLKLASLFEKLATAEEKTEEKKGNKKDSK